jgi:outer membrane cobalamin receptor
MPDKKTIEAVRRDKRQGKSVGTQAGEFVREEIHHIREGKHGARSTKQAIAIGLSKARRAGVELPASKNASPRVKKQASREIARAHDGHTHAVSPRRSRAMKKALSHESHAAASHTALSRHAHAAAMKHTHAERSAAAKKAAVTRAHEKRRAA